MPAASGRCNSVTTRSKGAATRAARASAAVAAKETLNRWIATETTRTAREITAAIEAYKFNEAATAAYRFVWNLTCDWYQTKR